jgi:predicted nucleic acid-binding protein
MRKSQAPFKKIKEAFKPSDNNGVVDYAKGIELVSAEVQKLGSVASEVGNLAKIFGADEQTVEIINDVATSLNGVATAGQGIAQIASGDYIGGAVSVLSGITSVIGAWADNGNKKIDAKIKDSERAVKRLELAYIDLEHAMDEAYGTAEIGAQRAIIVNKELQLAELKRQLQLEQSRKAKNKDEDRILELRKQIRELEYDIVDSINGITNSLLGISSVGNAAETLVTNMIAAFKKGEQFMDEYKQSFDDMIDNMIMKAIVSNVIGKRMQELFDRIQKTAEDRASSEKEAYEKAAKEYEQWMKLAEGWIEEYYYFDPKTFAVDRTKKITKEEQDELWKQRLEYLKKQYEAAMTPTPDDVQGVRDDVKNWRDSVKEEFMAYMDAFGIKYGQDSTKQLSALQQGIGQISEQTANALEAYANSISQQAYLRNDLLVQIRDTIMSFNMDVQLGVFSQMLLQLQNNYIVMQSMQSMMEGWTTPSGSGIRVELLS